MRKRGFKGHSRHIGKRNSVLNKTGRDMISQSSKSSIFMILAILLTISIVGSIIYIVYQFVCAMF